MQILFSYKDSKYEIQVITVSVVNVLSTYLVIASKFLLRCVLHFNSTMLHILRL